MAAWFAMMLRKKRQPAWFRCPCPVWCKTPIFRFTKVRHEPEFQQQKGYRIHSDAQKEESTGFVSLLRNPVRIHDAEFADNPAPVFDRHSPFPCYLSGGKVQSLHKGHRAWEHASLAVYPAVRWVQAFYGIGCINDPSDLKGELEYRSNRIPVRDRNFFSVN